MQIHKHEYKYTNTNKHQLEIRSRGGERPQKAVGWARDRRFHLCILYLSWDTDTNTNSHTNTQLRINTGQRLDGEAESDQSRQLVGQVGGLRQSLFLWRHCWYRRRIYLGPVDWRITLSQIIGQTELWWIWESQPPGGPEDIMLIKLGTIWLDTRHPESRIGKNWWNI